MKMKLLLGFASILVSSLATAFPWQSSSQKEAEQYIIESEHQWAEAEVTLDYKLAERILADDFVGIAPDGSHYGKADEIGRTKRARPTSFPIKWCR